MMRPGQQRTTERWPFSMPPAGFWPSSQPRCQSSTSPHTCPVASRPPGSAAMEQTPLSSVGIDCSITAATTPVKQPRSLEGGAEVGEDKGAFHAFYHAA